MKKIFYLLIGLLLLPSMVKADMASPEVIMYDASVTNPNGIPIYVLEDSGYVDTGKKLPYGTVIKEIHEDDPVVIDNELVEGAEKGKFYVVMPSDLTATKSEYKITDKELGEEFGGYLTLVDIDIKKGPAASYPSTGKKIKAGTEISMRAVKIYDSEATDDDDYTIGPWYYVEYEGTKGFVDVLGDTIVMGDIKEIEAITAAKVEILDPKTKKVIKTIEPSTKIKAKIGDLDDWNRDYYIEYDGVKGIVNSYHIVIKHISKEEKNNQYVFESDMKIYDYAFNGDEVGGGNVVGTLPANTAFTSYYEAEYGFVYYENDTVKGWIDSYEEVEKDQPKKEETKKQLPKKEKTDVVVKPKNDYTLYICIGAAAVISITAIVVIVLLNKKKKSKEL